MGLGLVRIGEFPNGALAALAQGLLAEEGIEAQISGVTVQAWGGGDVPMTGVTLEVRTEDAERARALLDEVEARTRARVGAEERGGGAEADPFALLLGDDETPPAEPDEPAGGPPPAGAPAPGDAAGPPPAAPSEEDVPPLPRGDRAARRALACAVFGCMVPVFTLAALALLLDGAIRRDELPSSPRGRRTWRWAVAWNVLGFAVLSLRWSLWGRVGEGRLDWLWWFWVWL